MAASSVFWDEVYHDIYCGSSGCLRLGTCYGDIECVSAGTKFLILVLKISNEKNESRMVFENIKATFLEGLALVGSIMPPVEHHE
jgi:hypothetical protein